MRGRTSSVFARGRISAVFGLVVTGGLACILAAGLVVAFPRSSPPTPASVPLDDLV